MIYSIDRVNYTKRPTDRVNRICDWLIGQPGAKPPQGWGRGFGGATSIQIGHSAWVETGISATLSSPANRKCNDGLIRILDALSSRDGKIFHIYYILFFFIIQAQFLNQNWDYFINIITYIITNKFIKSHFLIRKILL